jgi:hypothetical protein
VATVKRDNAKPILQATVMTRSGFLISSIEGVWEAQELKVLTPDTAIERDFCTIVSAE